MTCPQAYGPVLSQYGLGLAAYGAYMFVEAKYRRVNYLKLGDIVYTSSTFISRR